ncbi:hypothetical protein [Streptomyces sp. NPDC050848]|uniref:hypothetical protein n=1 Tax=Streptomyces sp. NPDC050848 TaxID=3155791 RepID=UPI0033CF8352
MTDSTDETLQIVRTAFARLARENTGLTDIDRKIMRAFEQLMLGRPEVTDGRTSAVNICAEAGVSRASYYRSPVAGVIKDVLSSPDARRPAMDELRQEMVLLKQSEAHLRREKAAEIRELRATVAAYANQIQVLALRNAELEADVRDLHVQLDGRQEGVIRQLRRLGTGDESPSNMSRSPLTDV